MASLNPTKSPHFLMSSGHFRMDQIYGLNINNHQGFFCVVVCFPPQAYGTEVNYCPSLDLSADNLSDQVHIPGIQGIALS